MAENKMSGAITKATTSVAKAQPKTMKDYVQSMSKEIERALPSVITPERFTRMTLTAISNNPQLAECTPKSFLSAVMASAQLGLEPNTALGQAYILPRRNKGTLEAEFQLGYRGLLDLAWRSGELVSIIAEEVREGDVFEFEYGLEPKLRHIPARENRGNPIYYYACFKNKAGGSGFHVMSVEEMREFAKKYSKAYGSSYSPWNTNFSAMAKKGLAVSTPIPTPYGWTTMGDIEVGDIVFDMYGSQTKVIATSEIKHLPCFKVNFSNGDSIVCDNEHRWVAGVDNYNVARKVRTHGWETLTVNELYEAKKKGMTVVVPVTPALDLEEKDLKIHPWVLGYWLGNGSKQHGNVCCDLKDAEYIQQKIKMCGYEVGAVRKDKRSNAVTITVLGLLVQLRDECVLNNKHIPNKYLRSSFEQRLALLQGLVDSDGHIDNTRGRAVFTSTSKKLFVKTKELVISLGEQASTSKTWAKGFGKEVLSYAVTWKPVTNPATLPRKAERFKERLVAPYKSIKSIEVVESVPTRCIAVEAPSKTYLAGLDMTPTHNTVLKQVLKFAPLRTELMRELSNDGTIKNSLAEDMSDVPNEMEYVEVEAEEAPQTDENTAEKPSEAE